MKVPRLRGIAAAAVALATVALPLQAMAAPHGDDGLGRCNQVLMLMSQYPQLAQAYPALQRAEEECSSATGFQMAGFDDLNGFGWAADDINMLQTMGIMNGVGHGRFLPAGRLSRVQFAALLTRVFHLSVPANPITFIDVPPSYWGYDAVEAAAPYMGEFQTPGGLAFEPDLPMLRIDVAATIGKIEVAEGLAQLPTAAQAEAIWAGFTDGSLVPAGISQYAAVAVQSGIMKGYANGSFGVDDTLNRAQAAVLLVRVLEGTETMPGGTGSIGGTSTLQGTFEAAFGSSVVILVNGAPETLTLATTGVTVTVNGQSATLASLTPNEAVTLTLNAQGQVIAIAATNGNTGVTTLSGTVVSAGSTTLVLDVNGTDVTLAVAPGVTVSATPGESVTVSLNAQGQVVSITVTGTTSTVSGTIVSVGPATIEINVNGTLDTFAVTSGATVTINGAASNLSSLTAGESATLTLNASGQVTAIAVSGPVATHTVTGYIVAVSASDVAVAVYGTGGASATAYAVDTGAQITLNGTTTAVTSLPLGDAATVGLDSNNGVASIAASTPSGQVSGTLVGISGTQVSMVVNGNLTTVTVGSAPVAFSGGSAVALSSLLTETVTIDPTAMGGSALVVH
jgi:hypothetical protein